MQVSKCSLSGVNVSIEQYGVGEVIEGCDIETVTVSVITYNSSKYVIETLDSIKRQTYPNIALIISDDKSTDDTLSICRNWVKSNLSRFARVIIIEPERNTGVSANCNRAWDSCETRYLKNIAGDDILLPNCISDNMDYIKSHPEAKVVFSKVKSFISILGVKFCRESGHNYSLFELSTKELYDYLMSHTNQLPAASLFADIHHMREQNCRFDERIPLLEDFPMWINLCRKGIHFYYLDDYTVLYRINQNSLSIGLFGPSFFKSNILFYLYYYVDENDKVQCFEQIAEQLTHFYKSTYAAANSGYYKLGYAVIFPFNVIKKIVKFILRKIA